MAKFRKKPVVIEAFTFNEMVQFGLQDPDANIVDGAPWSFSFKGHNITHESDILYLIPTLEGVHNMTPDDMLMVGVSGEIYPCKIDIFNKTYDRVYEDENVDCRV